MEFFAFGGVAKAGQISQSPKNNTVLRFSVGFVSAACLICSTDAKAVTVFKFDGNSQSPAIGVLTAPSRTFTVGGISLTIDNAVGSSGLQSFPSNQNTIGGINTDASNGLCANIGFTQSGQSGCQYTAAAAGQPAINGFTLTFDKSVYLISLDILRPGGTFTGILDFSSINNAKQLTFSNPGGGEISSGVVFRTLNFQTPFLARANTPIIFSSADSIVSTTSASGFRINNLSVDVPGPLPVLGVAATFAWSRRLKKKLKS
jgi:hypothetical protein